MKTQLGRLSVAAWSRAFSALRAVLVRLRSLASLASWRRVLVLIIALINLKTLPLAWHFRLAYHFVTKRRNHPGDPLIQNAGQALDIKRRPTHPIFSAFSIYTHAPFMEVDYNIHKSNSTYFADLDIARTALMSRMYTPGIAITVREMEKEAPSSEGPLFIPLGSVYCSFRREIKPYERFEIRTQIAAWDDKWTYLLSYFLRPQKRKSEEGPTLLAVALSKYVVKRGRTTLLPERVFRAGGFLPPRPEGWPTAPMVGRFTVEPDETSTTGTPSADGIAAPVEDVGERLVRNVLTLNEDQLPPQEVLDEQRRRNSESWSVQDWSWEKIEQERRRNLQIIEGYVKLDQRLYDEWKA